MKYRELGNTDVELSALNEDDFRKSLPRYQGDYADNNHKLAAEFARIADRKNCTPVQLSLAWVLAQGDQIIPIPGTTKRNHLGDNVGAVDVSLSEEDLEEIESLLEKYPDIGDRYNDKLEQLVDKS